MPTVKKDKAMLLNRTATSGRRNAARKQFPLSETQTLTRKHKIQVMANYGSTWQASQEAMGERCIL
jgi:hypothetical protein